MKPTPRDYSLVGRDSTLAEENGLVAAEWYAVKIDRKELKRLMRRSDGPAIRDTLIWFAALLLSGAGGVYFWGTLWCVPFFLVYGVLYGSSSDSRWHESGHGTAFKTRWMNVALYYIASFMIFREPTIWMWSHTRHHTDTIIVGRDPEIAAPRPPDIKTLLLNLFALVSTWKTIRSLLRHAGGSLSPDEETFVPQNERPKVYLIARIYIAIIALVVLACIATGSILPAMLIGLPTIYGGFMTVFFGLTQHAGLAEDVLDHRLNSRTIYMNPIFRFLYLNMNYHIEHHMFPMVPYHALPQLHEAIKHDCPPPYPSTAAAYREIIPTLLKQVKDPGFYIHRKLPEGVDAVPHNPGAVFKPAQ
ncbi:fatty acid desaturase family protein [Hoeflea prorocentri]|uniref:Fatty acid desaturase family protein n=1 Tax=Hoeflea prorocentri TaxID=1922333 RepID=A0A9X3UI64_9HYPH|nr:fatty acid desaturase family protein [Hoeflea prorocentri]MCY6381782.1 fatty acid desaturase family protein [Hoeflea prorocentri]MDA5399582.1 fatty acid desaturase family protein [Hoeflea prorocentri]